jgi:SAM-dependent methyltransferase
MTVSYESDERRKRAVERAAAIDRLIGLKGKRVLEVGCGHGDVSRVMAEDYGCEVVGVEILPLDTWEELAKVPNLKLVETDISQSPDAFEENSFDLIISFVVWEHMRHPWSGLKNCQRFLKPDGKKYLHAYLCGWPMLSHLRGQIDTPWSHLLMSETEALAAVGRPELPWYYYCNRLSYQHYRNYFRRLGFFIEYEVLIREPVDENFLAENDRILGLYPDFDLRLHGFITILGFDEKSPKQPIADPVYRIKTPSKYQDTDI